MVPPAARASARRARLACQRFTARCGALDQARPIIGAIPPVAALANCEASDAPPPPRSEEHTSELQSLMRLSYAVFCLKKKKNKQHQTHYNTKHTKKHIQIYY